MPSKVFRGLTYRESGKDEGVERIRDLGYQSVGHGRDHWEKVLIGEAIDGHVQAIPHQLHNVSAKDPLNLQTLNYNISFINLRWVFHYRY